MKNDLLVTAVLFTPLLGLIPILFWPKARENQVRWIALIFSVFLTNPAPLCVLDEVDAPLDDANVDRFCRLVADIADSTDTRFLLITHHRVTMARMDRLFGVTMAERGVSQLVSVDLARAAELRQTA